MSDVANGAFQPMSLSNLVTTTVAVRRAATQAQVEVLLRDHAQTGTQPRTNSASSAAALATEISENVAGSSESERSRSQHALSVRDTLSQVPSVLGHSRSTSHSHIISTTEQEDFRRPMGRKNWGASTTPHLGEITDDLARFNNNEIVKEAMEKGIDLCEYSRQIDKELLDHERASISDYNECCEQIVKLARDINLCDSTLESMETVLNGFQNKLNETCKEIEYLQDQSTTMKIKLHNRQDVESHLFNFLQAATVSPELIRNICEGKVNSTYLKYLHQLMEQVNFIRSRSDSDEAVGLLGGDLLPIDTAAVLNIGPQIEKLRQKAVSKIRRYLLDQISSLREPSTNVQMVQQNKLRKFADFLVFLRVDAPQVASEVERTYVMTMSQVFLDLFRSYHSSLLELRAQVAEEGDVIGALHAAPSHGSGVFGGLFSSAGRKDAEPVRPGNAFSVDHRLKVLQRLSDPPIIVHIAAAQKQRFAYEVLFRSLQQHLMALATFEFRFIGDFFRGTFDNDSTTNHNRSSSNAAAAAAASIPSKVAETMSVGGEGDGRDAESGIAAAAREDADDEIVADVAAEDAVASKSQGDDAPAASALPPRQLELFRTIFRRTCNECLEQLEACLLQHYDALGLLLMIKITNVNIRSMRAKEVPCLEHYFQGILDRLWPRFQYVIQQNCDSLNAITLDPAHQPDTAAGGHAFATEPQAHFAARRCADLGSSILAVGEHMDDSELHEAYEKAVSKLIGAMRQLLARLATAFQLDPRKHAVFYINNFNQMIPIFHERATHSAAVAELEQLCALQVDRFVEAELSEYFEKMIAFVQHTNLQRHVGGAGKPKPKALELDANQAYDLLNRFSGDWKKAIRSIDTDVIKFFSNYRRGVGILHKVLTQMLLYYTRFIEIISHAYPRQRSQFAQVKVNIQSIMYEIKRVSRTFD